MKRSYRSPDTTALEKESCQAHSFIFPTLQLGVGARAGISGTVSTDYEIACVDMKLASQNKPLKWLALE
jgi:hypothetical protein